VRLAVISDIHGNLEAFREVLADIDQAQVDAVACLGDNIGYGPEPEAVVSLLCERSIPSVMGNHELAIVAPGYRACMNPLALESLLLTEELLSEKSRDFIHTLKPSMHFHGSLCVHGCPPDSVTTYLFELSRAAFKELLLELSERVCFVGHTHDLQVICFDGQAVHIAPLRRGMITLGQANKYMINVGSVGQPRDGNNNAKYVIWDNVSETLEVRFIPYDISVTADQILKLGFPKFNAERLW
jgi:predicted phosphodiesterase